jgi:HAMP domain-containing protein
MRRLRASVRVALAACVLALVLLTAGATAAGYLIEAHNQNSDRAHRLAAAAAYLEHHATQAETTQWQQAMTRMLTTLGLRAQLTMVWLGGKRVVYASSDLVATTTRSPRRPAPAATTPSSPGAAQPTATYLFPLARGSGKTLTLDLYAPSPDRTRPVLVALASGLASLLAGAMLLLWAASRWLAAPLRRLNTQVDAIAGGDPFETRATSPVREVENVATAVTGMAAPRSSRCAATSTQSQQASATPVSGSTERGRRPSRSTGSSPACSTTRGRTSMSDPGCKPQTSQRRSPTRPPRSSSPPTSVESSSR